jgi:hypothetical protein
VVVVMMVIAVAAATLKTIASFNPLISKMFN